MNNGFSQPYPEFMGTNAIVPYLMEAVGYKNRDRQSEVLEGRTEKQVFLFFHQAYLKAVPCSAWYGTMAFLAPAASSNDVTHIC